MVGFVGSMFFPLVVVVSYIPPFVVVKAAGNPCKLLYSALSLLAGLSSLPLPPSSEAVGTSCDPTTLC